MLWHTSVASNRHSSWFDDKSHGVGDHFTAPKSWDIHHPDLITDEDKTDIIQAKRTEDVQAQSPVVLPSWHLTRI